MLNKRGEILLISGRLALTPKEKKWEYSETDSKAATVVSHWWSFTSYQMFVCIFGHVIRMD